VGIEVTIFNPTLDPGSIARALVTCLARALVPSEGSAKRLGPGGFKPRRSTAPTSPAPPSSPRPYEEASVVGTRRAPSGSCTG
jgi:hypothetical protein